MIYLTTFVILYIVPMYFWRFLRIRPTSFQLGFLHYNTKQQKPQFRKQKTFSKKVLSISSKQTKYIMSGQSVPQTRRRLPRPGNPYRQHCHCGLDPQSPTGCRVKHGMTPYKNPISPRRTHPNFKEEITCQTW